MDLLTVTGDFMFASQKFLEERDAQKKRKAATERQRRCAARKLLAARKASDEPIRMQLELLYKNKNLKPGDWVSASYFLAGTDAVDLAHLKTVETSRAIIGAQSFDLIRPRYLLEEL
jgi:hypothetical protein